MKPRALLLLLILAPLALAQDPVVKTKVAPPASSVAAWKGTIRKTIQSKGTFVPASASELKLDLEVYRGELSILEIKPNGSSVNEGDIIARLKTIGIDRQLTTEKMALERAELDWKQLQERDRAQQESDRAKRAKAELDLKRTEMKLDGYLKHEKAHNKENERLTLEGRRNRLDDQHDELVQLEKMYSEDELVDATEEIVLKRSRRNYARSKAGFELSERRRLYRKEFYEAWREEDLRRDVETKKRALESTVRGIEMARAKARLGAERKRYDLKLARERFADLSADRKQFVVRAPRAGLLLHGSAEGPWGKLKKGATLRNRRVFATVADPSKLRVKTTVAEKDILSVKNGMATEIVPTVSKKLKLMGRLVPDFLPGKGGKFAAIVELSDANRTLRPGMTCAARAIVAEAREVVLVPAMAVKDVSGRKIVRCAKTEQGPFEDRIVVTGISDGKNIAILEGLASGEYVRK